MEPAAPTGEKLAQLPAREPGLPLVGINVSGLLLMGGYSGNNMFGLKSDYRQLTSELVDYFVTKQNARVVLVPHVFGADPESDTAACEALLAELRPRFGDRLTALRGDFDQHEIKYVIGQCDFFLGSRMHACIAALSQCVPAVCLAYSRKFVGVMDSIGCAELAVDLCALQKEAVMSETSRIFGNRSSVRDSLQARIPKVREGVLKLFAINKTSSSSGKLGFQEVTVSLEKYRTETDSFETRRGCVRAPQK
jgi:polysaccharide pyruvyl transferase WcaK-like protein